MPEPWLWYESVAPEVPLLQGDFIVDCPLLGWKEEKPAIEGINEMAKLQENVEIIKADVIVMTQACDLENCKVSEVVVCPILSLTDLKTAWKQSLQNPSEKAWRNYCNDIRDGYLWNYAMLNKGEVDGLATEHRVVDFHNIYTLPVSFLEGLITARPGHRLRLRPPYREHLSQAFARYFMRVGLPSSIDAVW